MNEAKSGPGYIGVVAIVRDRLGRIVVDDEVFFDKERLEQLRQEVIKNGGNAPHGIRS